MFLGDKKAKISFAVNSSGILTHSPAWERCAFALHREAVSGLSYHMIMFIVGLIVSRNVRMFVSCTFIGAHMYSIVRVSLSVRHARTRLFVPEGLPFH